MDAGILVYGLSGVALAAVFIYVLTGRSQTDWDEDDIGKD